MTWVGSWTRWFGRARITLRACWRLSVTLTPRVRRNNEAACSMPKAKKRLTLSHSKRSATKAGAASDKMVLSLARGERLAGRVGAVLQSSGSAEYGRPFIEPTFEGVVLHDQGEILDANPVLAEMLGYTVEELIGFHVRELFMPESESTVMAKIASGNTGPYEAVAKHRDGSAVYVEIIARAVEYDGREIRMAALHDVTSRKLVEQQFRAANEALRAEQARLQRKNVALSELLERLQRERDEFASEIHANMERLVFPLLRQLLARVDGPDRRILNQLNASLREITAPFIYRLESAYSALSPREVEICSLIKSGLSCKDIASTLNTSVNTILKHRQRIRKKLGISNEQINLATYLKTI
ncbi:PAS domain S-box protein [candidate division GN15 bacterium]|nr:PAS domain S-box protein [candidate division GN15 bacterium]